MGGKEVGRPSLLPVPETRCAMEEEGTLMNKNRGSQSANCPPPHRGAIVNPMCIPSPPFRTPVEAQGLQLLSQVALELMQASL